MTDFAGKVAVITGGSKGIGFAAAEIMSRRGAIVALLDIDDAAGVIAVESLASEGGRAIAVHVDVANSESVLAAFAEVRSQLGSIDILVNNAGISGPAAPLWETSAEYFQGQLTVHILGAFYCVREVVPQMIERGYGRIVNVASVAGKEGNAGSGAYSSAKAGLIGMTKSLGKELATTGVLVNAVTPGIIDTTLVDTSTPEHIERLTAKIPMGRRGKATEVGEMIAWLSSDRCSFSTGAVFDISGGRTTY